MTGMGKITSRKRKVVFLISSPGTNNLGERELTQHS
jgi:hypothetical protein